MKKYVALVGFLGLLVACNGSKQKNETFLNDQGEIDEIIIEEDIPAYPVINIKDSLKINPEKGSVVENRYSGILPGANSAIEYDLTLFFQQDSKGGVYEINMKYLDAENDVENTFKSYGKREVIIGMVGDPKAIVYQLTPYDREESKINFALTKEGNLMILDEDLKKIESEHAYILKRIH